MLVLAPPAQAAAASRAALPTALVTLGDSFISGSAFSAVAALVRRL